MWELACLRGISAVFLADRILCIAAVRRSDKLAPTIDGISKGGGQ